MLMMALVIILLEDPGPSKQMLPLLMGLSSSGWTVPMNYLKSVAQSYNQILQVCSSTVIKFACKCCLNYKCDWFSVIQFEHVSEFFVHLWPTL